MRSRALVLVLLTACNRCDGPTEAPKDASSAPAVSEAAAPIVDAAPPPAPKDAADDDAKAAVLLPTDAGPSACRLVWGPAEQPFHGPAELSVAGSDLRVVINDEGKPRVFAVAISPISPISPITPPPKAQAIPSAPPAPESFVTARWPTCAVAGKWAFCAAKGGAITRTTLGATDAKEIGKSHPNTRIAAAPLGADHAVVAFLETHKTTEGDMLQAFAVLDDGVPARLSDDGAGANLVHLVAHGDGATAVYIDLRSAMLPVHARSVHAREGKLALGADTVPFIGGPPERGIDFTIASVKSASFVLIPMPRESTEFGVATVALADPPKPDVGASWSLYPNGLDPAPIAASGPYVVRLRPIDAKPGASRVVELGRVDEGGAFTSFGAIAEDPRIGHLAVATDAHGSVWILYSDPSHTWLERRVCP